MLFKLEKRMYPSVILKSQILSLSQCKDINSRINDFQGTTGVDVFNKFVKLGDSLVLASLLLKNRIIQQKIQHNHTVAIHDIGGADGAMMLTLLRILNFNAEITVNEPNEERLKTYQAKQTQFPNFFASIVGINKKIEDIHFVMPPKRDLVLASHVFYYNHKNWLTCDTLSGHLLTKILRSLSIHGLLCVILQHPSLETIDSHERWEDCIYPLVEKVRPNSNNFYAASDVFDAALSAYQKQFIYESGNPIDWVITTKIAKTSVPLGAVNTTPDPKTGQYQQTKAVLNILNFYLKGRSFNAFTAEVQKRIIDILLSGFKKNNQYEIVHYNKIYTIEIGQTLFHKMSELNAIENDPEQVFRQR